MVQVESYINSLIAKGFDISEGTTKRHYTDLGVSVLDLKICVAIVFVGCVPMLLTVTKDAEGYTVTTDISREEIKHGTANSQREVIKIIERALGF